LLQAQQDNQVMSEWVSDEWVSENARLHIAAWVVY
jgi:hypothetical protein